MGDHAKGVSKIPGREGVGRKTLMYQGQRRYHPLVTEIRIIGIHLIGQQHTLVAQRSARQRGNIKLFPVRHGGITNGMFDELANDKQFAFKGILVITVGTGGDEDLAHYRLHLPYAVTQATVVGRYVTPTEQLLTLRLDGALQQSFTGLSTVIRAG